MQSEMFAAVQQETIDINQFFQALPPETQDHCERVASVTERFLALALANGLCESEPLPLPLPRIREAVRFHDVGMTLIPDRILNKQEALTSAERCVVERHAGYGGKLLDKHRSGLVCTPEEDCFWRLAAEVAVSHHERWDGKGYPFGTVATAAILVARATAIVDTYDAIVRGAPYCMPLPREYALVEIMDKAGAQFDPTLAGLFLRFFNE